MPINNMRRKECLMGLSSNARLLSITARLTSNEYESQQISNAKMRLATKSQEASAEYLAALSSTDYAFMTFDAQGNALNIPLTAAVLYQYGESKNQYILANAAGQALLSREDAYNYENSKTLKEFLGKYGIHANYRTADLKEEYEYLHGDGVEVLKAWQDKVKEYKNNPECTAEWATDYENDKEVYNVALDNYNKIVNELSAGNELITVTKISDSTPYTVERDATTNEPETILYGPYQLTTTTEEEQKEELKEVYGIELGDRQYEYYESSDSLLNKMAALLGEIKEQYANSVTYDAYIEPKIKAEDPTLWENYDKYRRILNDFKIHLEELGITEDEVCTYDDTTKAQWYTNLWYRINGSSTNKSTNPNYAELDNKLLTSTSWIKDALAHGDISIEMSSYSRGEGDLAATSPIIEELKGISWTTKMFSSCPDITQRDDSAAIEKAEAEYQKALAEINIKDQKYQRKLTTLDSEHNALQTEYESVKSALSKNIERSFKAFQG